MVGPFLELAGVAALYVLVPAGSVGTWLPRAPICLALVAIGLGLGLAWPLLLTRVLRVTLPNEQELAGASITTVRLFAPQLRLRWQE